MKNKCKTFFWRFSLPGVWVIHQFFMCCGTDSLNAVRHYISVVFQDFGRYEESIRRNIMVPDFHREKTDEELYALLRMVGLDEVVKEFPNGLEEKIGVLSEQGRNLSGGQRQKCFISRSQRLAVSLHRWKKH